MARIIFICQTVDEKDPILATVVRWIKEFANHSRIEQMTVLTLRKGIFNLPDNVEVVAIKRSNDIATLICFYKEVLKRIFRINYFFIHMGGPYPILLLPFKLFLRKPIYQWKTRTRITLMMNFYARFCDNKIFTASPTSFPLPLSKVKVVGHGIDVEQFKIKNLPKSCDLIVTGRISPIKQIDKIIKLLRNNSYHMNIYGPVSERDVAYKRELDELVDKLGLSNKVFFRGAVSHNQLPDILNQHKVMVSFNKPNEGGLDKSVLEAMACGLPVITANPCVEEILPSDLKTLLIISQDNADIKIRELLSLSSGQLLTIGNRLREIVKNNHNVRGLADKIITEINL